MLLLEMTHGRINRCVQVKRIVRQRPVRRFSGPNCVDGKIVFAVEAPSLYQVGLPGVSDNSGPREATLWAVRNVGSAATLEPNAVSWFVMTAIRHPSRTSRSNQHPTCPPTR